MLGSTNVRRVTRVLLSIDLGSEVVCVKQLSGTSLMRTGGRRFWPDVTKGNVWVKIVRFWFQ